MEVNTSITDHEQAAEDPNPPSPRNDDDHAATIPLFPLPPPRPNVSSHPIPDKNDHLLTK